MTTIYLVRHGRHALVDRVLCGRSDDIGLASEGCEEADRLAAHFASLSIDRIQSSPRRRTRETAEPIAAAAGLHLECVDALDELDCGRWTGRSFESLAGDPRWHLWNARRDKTRVPGGESMAELQSRVVDHIEAVRLKGSASVVMVTHAEPIRAALLFYRNIPLDRFNEIVVAPGTVSILNAGRHVTGAGQCQMKEAS